MVDPTWPANVSPASGSRDDSGFAVCAAHAPGHCAVLFAPLRCGQLVSKGTQI